MSREIYAVIPVDRTLSGNRTKRGCEDIGSKDTGQEGKDSLSDYQQHQKQNTKFVE